MLDLVLRIKTLLWEKFDTYPVAGGYATEYVADNGDKIITSTCSTDRTKYFIKGKDIPVSSEAEKYIRNNF